MNYLSSIDIKLNHNQEGDEVKKIKKRKEQVIIIQHRLIKIVQNPSSSSFLRYIGYRRQQETAQEIPHP